MASAAIANGFLFIKQIGQRAKQKRLSWARHSYKAHDCAERSENDKQVEERTNSQRRRKVNRILGHSQKYKDTEQQKVQVINDHADGCVGKPTR
jgi:hypothetical protein